MKLVHATCLILVGAAIAEEAYERAPRTPSPPPASSSSSSRASPPAHAAGVAGNERTKQFTVDGTAVRVWRATNETPDSIRCTNTTTAPTYFVEASATTATQGDGPYCSDGTTCPGGAVYTAPVREVFAKTSSGTATLQCGFLDNGAAFAGSGGRPPAAGTVIADTTLVQDRVTLSHGASNITDSASFVTLHQADTGGFSSTYIKIVDPDDTTNRANALWVHGTAGDVELVQYDQGVGGNRFGRPFAGMSALLLEPGAGTRDWSVGSAAPSQGDFGTNNILSFHLDKTAADVMFDRNVDGSGQASVSSGGGTCTTPAATGTTMRGTVSAASCNTGQTMIVTFGEACAGTPKCSLTPRDATSLASGAFISAEATTGFTASAGTAAAAALSFNFHCDC